MNIHEKFTNSEMEGMCRAKGEWRCVEPPCLSEHSTLTSHTCVYHPGNNSLNFNIFTFFLKFQEVGLLTESLAAGHWPVVTAPSLSALSSPQRYGKYKPLFSSLNMYVGNSCSVWFSSCLKEINSSPMKKRKFQEFQEAWPMKQENDQPWIRK